MKKKIRHYICNKDDFTDALLNCGELSAVAVYDNGDFTTARILGIINNVERLSARSFRLTTDGMVGTVDVFVHI